MENRIATAPIFEEQITHTLQKGMDYIVSKKFPTPMMPQNANAPEHLPFDLSELPDNMLVAYMSYYSSLISFAKFESSKLDIERTAKHNAYMWKKSCAHVNLKSENKKDTEIKLLLEANTVLTKLKRDCDIAESTFLLTDALLFGYMQSYKVLSRELTRRGFNENRE